MNFSKNILRNYQILCYLNNTLSCRRNIIILPCISAIHSTDQLRLQEFTKRKSIGKARKFCSYSFPNITEIEEVTGAYPYEESQSLTRSEFARSILFKDNNDPRILEIAKCASVEEVFKFVRDNAGSLNYKYLTQIVLTLYDLQDIFIYHYGEEDDSELKEKFFKKLLEHQEFYMVTKALESSLTSFDPLFLSYSILYLNKLGVSEESQLIQDMALKLRDHLLDNFSLNIAARLIRVIFLEDSVRPYYIIVDLIPNIFDQIEQVETTKGLEYLTICLYKLSNILTDDVLRRFEAKVNRLIKDNILTEKDYQIILKVMSVFHHPKWRNKYCSVISKCFLLMRNSIELLNMAEMYQLYDIFFKNQEPGDALNAIQRAAAKLLHEIDDGEASHKNKLKLFSSVIYFSSPLNKKQFRQDIEKYMSEKETLSSLVTLRKIYSYLKISDPRVCDAYWNKVCQVLKQEKDFDKVIKLMENYMYFFGELQGFRHYAFEHHILTLIQKHFDAGSLTMFPSRFFAALAFALVSSYNGKLLDRLLQSLSKLSTQMAPIDIFRLSQSLQVLQQRKSIATPTQIQDIKNLLHQATAGVYSNPRTDPGITCLLVKASIVRNDFDNELIDDMLTSLKDAKYMSSKIMEYMGFNLYATKTLIPEIVNKCTEYIVHNKSHIVGFNAERMLFLLYQLNYQPVYEDEFFGTVIDIILRDQERLSGLGFLQAALSLCFFHRMPKSFVKQIFNVEFLDKLDVELANCYFRDRYPQRVRHILMQLNRAVCLEYPEYNVPWFHQKYIEEYQKTNAIDDVVNPFQRSVKEYLTGILGKETILENVTTPYGYDINFVLHLDKHKQPTTNFEDPCTTRIAVLLKSDAAFTRFYVRLKGKHALKNRHLEILGYKIKMIKRNEWLNLLYAKERVEFIKELVFS